MLDTLIRDTLIDLATKRYGRVTMVLSELAKPGVWKDKLMIASEKLYDDDYKYIYLKAVVEVLSELDEEWGRYAREVYLVEQRLQKVFSSCSKKYPSTSDAELMENLTVLANLSPVDYEGDDIAETCFRICKAVMHAYMLETNYSGRLDNIRIDLCQKSQYVIDRDSSEERLLSEINKLKFYAGENIFDDWKRYCKLAQAWYLYYDKYGKNKSGESMMKSVLLQAFTRQKADSYIECLCPSSSGRSSRESVFEKYNPNYLFDKVVTNLGDDNIDVCETNLYLLGIASEIKKSYLRRKVMKALQASLSDNVSEYKDAVKVALQAYVSQLRADKLDVSRLVNTFPPTIEQLIK